MNESGPKHDTRSGPAMWTVGMYAVFAFAAGYATAALVLNSEVLMAFGTAMLAAVWGTVAVMAFAARIGWFE